MSAGFGNYSFAPSFVALVVVSPQENAMKAHAPHHFHRAFVECSSHEVLGGIPLEKDRSSQLAKWTSSLNPSPVRISRLMRTKGARARTASSSHQHKAAFMIIFDSLRQRLRTMRSNSSEQRGRFLTDERKAERKRIARELHDTLLQGLQGVLLEMELFSRTSTLSEEQQKRAAEIEQRLRDIVTDGRDAISALRAPVDERDWMAVILDMGDRLAMESEIGFSLHIKGKPWNLQSTIRSEVLAIVLEGLRNAFEHSHAQDIHVTLSYARHRLKVAIQDNGIGLNEQRLQLRQKEGHWGIAGMRERTDKLGGRLTIASQPFIGTSINVVVPRHSLFRAPTTFGLREKADVRPCYDR